MSHSFLADRTVKGQHTSISLKILRLSFSDLCGLPANECVNANSPSHIVDSHIDPCPPNGHILCVFKMISTVSNKTKSASVCTYNSDIILHVFSKIKLYL